VHTKSPYIIRASEVEPYSPANHTGRKNYQLVGPNVNSAKHMEIALGDIERNEGSPAHAHPVLEQAVYVLEGEAIAGIDSAEHHVRAGDMMFFAPSFSFDQGSHCADQASRNLLATLRRGSLKSDPSWIRHFGVVKIQMSAGFRPTHTGEASATDASQPTFHLDHSVGVDH